MRPPVAAIIQDMITIGVILASKCVPPLPEVVNPPPAIVLLSFPASNVVVKITIRR